MEHEGTPALISTAQLFFIEILQTGNMYLIKGKNAGHFIYVLKNTSQKRHEFGQPFMMGGRKRNPRQGIRAPCRGICHSYTSSKTW